MSQAYRRKVTATTTQAIGTTVAIADSAEQLRSLARQVERLAPCHRDPERFHLSKSEIAHGMRILAKVLTS